MFSDYKVVIKGGGELASAVAHRLHQCGFPVIITEIDQPRMERRYVSFGNSIYENIWTVEGATSKLITFDENINEVLSQDLIPVIIDPECNIAKKIHPTILIDGILAKKNTGTSIDDAPIVIGMGPGFTAGKDVHAVIETNIGHYLGMVILDGTSQSNTGIPWNISGYTHERVFRAPKDGILKNCVDIGDMVVKDDTLCFIDDIPVKANISGVIRGIMHNNLPVKIGEKLGDIDPQGKKEYCFTISDRGRTISGGVLEAVLYFLNRLI
ncbi:MAG: selenium-dependent molybdenum cofactor biosynthesis protein YqeB [Tepidanaerobacteraceae bacterium]|jgi:xanthine dehydrogenase accessory factor|nr:selenium-dependent molybdenum cofactor biosynthesis protein YqeB [Tepidanaerobacteraceae bacterium]